MGCRMDSKDTDRMFTKPQKEYEIQAPKRFAGKGRYSDADLTKYARVDRAEEIGYREKPDLLTEEVLSLITQSLFYFTEDESIESKVVSKRLFIFIRSCDIYAQHHQEKIYLTNGDYEDTYYKRINEKVKIVMMECGEGWDTRFRASMGTNRTDDYSMAARFGENALKFQVEGDAFVSYFKSMEECPSEPRFVERNELTLMVSKIPDKEVLTKPREHPMWRQFGGRCISCDARTVVCSTYTCFTTTDIIYNGNHSVGKRKRTSASCQVKDFTDMAGGMSFRNRAGDRMRYKVLHKFYDYKVKFKDYHIRTGCGRRMDRRPECIPVMTTVNRMAGAVVGVKADRQAQERGRSRE